MSRKLVLISSFAVVLAACGGTAQDAPAAPVAPPVPPSGGGAQLAEPTWEEIIAGYEIPAEFKQMQFVGSSEGGGGHTWWIAASQLLNKNLGMETTVRPGATRENALLQESGEIKAATISPVDLIAATENPGALASTPIRTLWAKFNVAYWAAVPENSSAEKLSDLVGSRVAIGIAGGGESALFLEAIECAGLDANQFTLEFTGKGEAIGAFNDGSIDAWAAQGPNPTPQLLEAFSGRRGAKLLTIDPEIIDCLAETGKFVKGEIPAETYPGQSQAYATVNQWFYATISEDVPEEVVYLMARALDENYAELLAAFRGATTSTAENTATAIGFELHPGTERYLRERGLLN